MKKDLLGLQPLHVFTIYLAISDTLLFFEVALLMPILKFLENLEKYLHLAEFFFISWKINVTIVKSVLKY